MRPCTSLAGSSLTGATKVSQAAAALSASPRLMPFLTISLTRALASGVRRRAGTTAGGSSLIRALLGLAAGAGAAGFLAAAATGFLAAGAALALALAPP